MELREYETRIPIARENIRRAGKEDCITLIEGDALEVMAGLEPGIRTSFLWMRPRDSISIFFRRCLRLLKEGRSCVFYR